MTYMRKSEVYDTLRISGTIEFGPFDEKAAMKGAGFVCNFVVGCVM